MNFANTKRSNRNLFIPVDTGSPRNGLMNHISSLGQIARLDFERHAIAGDVIFAVEGDASPIAPQEEEARIGTLAYALKKLGAAEDAAEFTRCLNVLCEEGDARSRQAIASYYYNEIGARGTSSVLKEMALLAMQLASLQAVAEESEMDAAGSDPDFGTEPQDCQERPRHSLFEQELRATYRLIRGHRKATRLPHDDFAEWVNDLEAHGASVEEIDEALEHLEAMAQYDEGGAILAMSGHERTVACGRIDEEFTVEDLPERAQPLAGELRRMYAGGVPLESIWDDLTVQIEVLFPVRGRTETGERFYSHANREWQQFTRQVLETLLAECEQDFHLTALRSNRLYREFHKAIRGVADTGWIGDLMKRAYEARLSGALPLKHFTALKTAAILQRERLESARLSPAAMQLLKEVETASEARLRFLAWACYGNNQPDHPIHKLVRQEAGKIWDAIKHRKQAMQGKLAA